ncbi:MAG: AAA family ATPase [Alcaligenaceae bacterium]|nr:AAA family ATPase [Alcaligenaceae bacterium]
MKRELMNSLEQHANCVSTVRILLQGGLGVGKSWLMKTFASKNYKRCIYLDFLDTEDDISFQNMSYAQFLDVLENRNGIVRSHDRTILLLDHVHEVPSVSYLLKAFMTQFPKISVMMSSDFLNPFNHKTCIKGLKTFTVSPMNFMEFLYAMDEDVLCHLLKRTRFQELQSVHQELVYLLQEYMYVGGMPEVVSAWIMSADYQVVRKTQRMLLAKYHKHIQQYTDYQGARDAMRVWRMIVPELSKSNKRFMFNHLGPSMDHAACTRSLAFLERLGLVYRVPKTDEPVSPVRKVRNGASFKLYFYDVGLLGAQMGTEMAYIHDRSFALFEKGCGALKEQYVLSELISNQSVSMFYYQNRLNVNSIAYILETNQCVVPIQIRLLRDKQSKVLKAFNSKFNPAVSVNFSLEPFYQEGDVLHCPLYLVSILGSKLQMILPQEKTLLES